MFVHVCRAPRIEPSSDRLLGIYRSEPTHRLIALHRALITERTTATTPDVRAFCDYRLPLVAQVLIDRGCALEDAPRCDVTL